MSLLYQYREIASSYSSVVRFVLSLFIV